LKKGLDDDDDDDV